jgi:hypothetical protein
MATRPGEGGQATRKQSNGRAVATLGFGIAGLILGVLSPPALLLGLVAGLVCLLLTLLFLTGFFES